jgi:hypothetical protein
MNPNQESSTTNVILVILLVIVVGFVVWYVTSTRGETQDTTQESGAQIQVNLGGDQSKNEPVK